MGGLAELPVKTVQKMPHAIEAFVAEIKMLLLGAQADCVGIGVPSGKVGEDSALGLIEFTVHFGIVLLDRPLLLRTLFSVRGIRFFPDASRSTEKLNGRGVHPRLAQSLSW